MRRLARVIKVSIVISVSGLLAYIVIGLLTRRPVLIGTPGEWDCACGDMLIKTTRRGLWNPLRDRAPEIVAVEFLAGLRAGNCTAGIWCADVLSRQRVSGWSLAWREDSGDTASLYFKLTKYAAPASYNLQGVGAVDLHKDAAGWSVSAYSAYF